MQIDPNKIKQKEYWGLSAIVLGTLILVPTIGTWLFADGLLAGVGIGIAICAAGMFIIATLPDPDGL